MERAGNRVIFHADMDAFYAAIEQLDFPELRGKPVIVGGTSNRGVVSTASYEARPFGVGSAMPIAEARRRCPEGIFVPVRMERYREVSRCIMEVFDQYSPLVEPLSLDEAFLDMTGSAPLLGDPVAVARRLKDAVRSATGGLTVSVGVAPNKFLAKVASDRQKPDGLTVVQPDEVSRFLNPLPIACLWGVGPKTQARLLDLGCRTIGDVARADMSLLTRRFKKMGAHLRSIACGIDSREVVPHRDPKSIGAERTLSNDVTGAAQIEPYLRESAERTGRRLRRKSLVAAGVRVKLKTADFQSQTRQGPLAPPTDSSTTIFEGALSLLDQMDLSRRFRLVGLAVFDLCEKGAVQQSLFVDPKRKRDEQLDQLLDGIKDKFGEDVIKKGE